MEYKVYRDVHGQGLSTFVMVSDNTDVLTHILDYESESRYPRLVYILNYRWREYPAWQTSYEYRGRRRNMTSSLACTCKLMQNYIQRYMNPNNLTMLTRTILHSNADYALWCKQRSHMLGGIEKDPIDLCRPRGIKRSRAEYENGLDHTLLDYEFESSIESEESSTD